jgi:toxin ParE1/3/4
MSELAIIRTSRSEQDLLAIWKYIARDNENAATSTLRRIDEKIARLAHNPTMGERLPGFDLPLRRITVGSYVVVYQVLPDAVQVVRILHSAQQWEELL